VRALRGDPNVKLLVAGRRKVPVPAAEDVPGVLVDINEAGLMQGLKALSPGLVIHCVGPFQGQDYRVANAALAAGAHYLDLADGRQFIDDNSDAKNFLVILFLIFTVKPVVDGCRFWFAIAAGRVGQQSTSPSVSQALGVRP
jgi:hypothetical protein